LHYKSDGLNIGGYVVKPKKIKGHAPVLILNRGGNNDGMTDLFDTYKNREQAMKKFIVHISNIAYCFMAVVFDKILFPCGTKPVQSVRFRMQSK
jgi:hypothetical protein